jgi:hypothetical protein
MRYRAAEPCAKSVLDDIEGVNGAGAFTTRDRRELARVVAREPAIQSPQRHRSGTHEE